MLQREKWIVGNWKMHGNLAENAALIRDLLSGLTGPQPWRVCVCVPFPYLAQSRELLGASAVGWGAQDASAELAGAFTGQVSVAMLKEFGCEVALVGHSERRKLNGETSELVAAKAARCVSGGLMPIVCVGESLAEREAGRTEAVISAQLAAVIDSFESAALERIILAYEPVWAIGTGKTATPAQAQEVHAMLRAQIGRKSRAVAQRLPILYGGSVKPGNAKELLGMPDIDGALVGGASLVANDFLGIVGAAKAP